MSQATPTLETVKSEWTAYCPNCTETQTRMEILDVEPDAEGYVIEVRCLLCLFSDWVLIPEGATQ